ncbi:solute carrier family 41 member 1 isoform X1 [Zeugodacus cucurbitae]|uniref:solute carrier family 41 member 1 isoform X1 n=1 Tax=Zeugodacus cucurbitae TaxID=28588 RepID=UPI0005968D94|nr:solute carrier family 41 member 1 isoform X1 [Zeugodacus cucurbitae]XP_054087645.1 solute carrier family 41 member 1 isoform X1 [Zeugodacus cucurbitae]
MPSPSKKQSQPHLSLMTNSSDDYLKLADDAGISNEGFQAPPTPQTATTNICDSMEFISTTPDTMNTKHTNNNNNTDELVLRNNSNNNSKIQNNINNKNNKNDNNTPYYTSNNGVPHGHYRYTLPLSLTAPLPQPLPPTIAPQKQQLQKDQQQDDKYRLYTIYGNDTDNDKLSGLPQSTTGSLSSIITTSIASSEPDPGTGGGGRGSGGGGGGGHGGSGIGALDATSIAGVPGSSDEKLALNRPGIKQEKWSSILLQVSIPFFLAGVGTIGAGIVLGRVEKWRVFKEITELFILVPSLLGLKGNLDMCLASRLSTQVNLGNMTSRKEVIRMIVGNIALVQVQATVASFLVAMFAIVVGAAMDGTFFFEHVMLLIASAMFTATSSCFVLDFVLVAVILLSEKFHLNPDNLATPLAASIGDVVSISILSFIASILFDHIKTHLWITFVVVACYLVLLPMWVAIVLKNKYTRPVLKSGWVPVLSALCISGLGGLVLDASVEIFNGFVVFQPIINGIGGNLVSVQASKISTMLHQSSIIGIIPPHTKIFEWPWKALFKGVPYAKTARILLGMSIPGNIVFVFVADYIHMSTTTVTVAFVISFLMASLIQVMLLLYIAHVIVHAMWKWKIDPDNSSIPYLTALGDLLGSSLLALSFLFLLSINQEYGTELNELNASN